MKKRVMSSIAIVLITTLLMGLAAGCGGGGATPTAGGQPGGSQTDDAGAPATNDPPADDGKVYKMRIGSVSSPPTPEAVFIMDLVDIIKEATGGRIEVEAYPSGQLGTAVQIAQGLQDGSVEGVAIPANYFEAYVPELGILGLPMFYTHPEQAYDFCRTPGNGFHEILNELLEAKGFVIGCWGLGSSSPLISTKPVSKFEDFKGLKIWCNPNARIVDTLNALGAAPVNFDTGDLAVGIQQGTIDAAYVGPQLIAPQGLQDTAKNLFIMSEPMTVAVISATMLSKSFVDSLPQDLRDILLETLFKAGHEVHYPMSAASIESSLETLKNADGMTVVYSDDEFTEKAREAVSTVRDKFLGDTPSAQELYDIAVDLIAAEG